MWSAAPRRRFLAALAVLLATCASAGCRQDMFDQAKVKPMARSEFFDDGRAARPPVPGTVARGQLNDDEHLHTGRVGGALVTMFPYEVTREMLDRGRERYNIFCTPCHDPVGNGNGMIVRRGFRQPPSLHDQRLREAPVGHHFDVITNGLGAMPDNRAQIPVHDRWAIVAYIRALQLSQNATTADVPPAEMQKLREPEKPDKQ